jgi:hypothetical protein
MTEQKENCRYLLGDTMVGTRRHEELARAAGEAFSRIVRTRR